MPIGMVYKQLSFVDTGCPILGVHGDCLRTVPWCSCVRLDRKLGVSLAIVIVLNAFEKENNLLAVCDKESRAMGKSQ